MRGQTLHGHKSTDAVNLHISDTIRPLLCLDNTLAFTAVLPPREPGVVNIELVMSTIWVAADIEFAKTFAVYGEGRAFHTSKENNPRRVSGASQIEIWKFDDV